MLQRKTKGQQLKGKIVSALFHTFSHFKISTLFHTFQHFSPRAFLKIKAFLNKRKKEKDQTMLHVSCFTFVLL